MKHYDYRDNEPCFTPKATKVITKVEVGQQMYDLIKVDARKIRDTYGKQFHGESSGMIVRCGYKFWVTQHSDNPDDLTIEQYRR